MERVFDLLMENLFQEYEKVKEEAAQVRTNIQELVKDVEKSLIKESFNLLPLLGNITGGISLSTISRVSTLINRFNKVVQDVLALGPNAEAIFEDNVKKVVDKTQNFFSSAADKLQN